jgi:hypothetical protein
MCPRDDFSTSIIDARGTIRDRNSRLIHGAVSIRERTIRGWLKCKSVSRERTSVPRNFDSDACVRENFLGTRRW